MLKVSRSPRRPTMRSSLNDFLPATYDQRTKSRRSPENFRRRAKRPSHSRRRRFRQRPVDTENPLKQWVSWNRPVHTTVPQRYRPWCRSHGEPRKHQLHRREREYRRWSSASGSVSFLKSRPAARAETLTHVPWARSRRTACWAMTPYRRLVVNRQENQPSRLFHLHTSHESS